MSDDVKNKPAYEPSETEAQVLSEYLDPIFMTLPIGVAILEGPDFR